VFPALPKEDENVSAKSLARLAADRDTNLPGQSVVKDSTDVLVAAVPTEALAAYTAVIGVVLAANIGASYGPFRWSAYGVFIALAVLAPLVLVKRRAATTDEDMRKLPVPECLTAGVAAAAWGLVMPGNPLTMIVKGNALVFATTAILVGTTAIISLAAQQLGTANSRNALPTEVAAPAAEEEAPSAAAEGALPTVGGTVPAEQTPSAVVDGERPAAEMEGQEKREPALT
jgi:hypothetical protein